MSVNNWDPLMYNLSDEIVLSTIKRQIKNILKSYTGWFDPLCELIQNALDAIDTRRKKDKDFHDHKLWIQINLKENSISVTDSGIGFTEEQFLGFLAPNVSFKEGDTRGNKGVGATYLAYGFNFLQIGTKNPDYTFVGNIKEGREWIEDNNGVKTRPKVLKAEPIHKAFNGIDRGSTFSIKLEGEYIRPKNLTWVGANNAEQWDIVLRTKTPLGGIYFTKEYITPECSLEVIDENGAITTKDIKECEYIYISPQGYFCMQNFR